MYFAGFKLEGVIFEGRLSCGIAFVNNTMLFCRYFYGCEVFVDHYALSSRKIIAYGLIN